jgi:predicted dehydrogenase
VTVDLAIVGLGYWGPNLARAAASIRDGRLSAICDADPARLERFSTLYPGAKAYSDLEALLADDSVDAVVLATPVASHFRLAERILQSGRHVLVEKPLAQTAAECVRLIELAREHGTVLMVGHVFLYNAAVRKVKEYVDSGELGEIFYLYSQRLNLGKVRQDVNALWNFAPHDFSIMSYWLGATPDRVSARGYSYVLDNTEDVVFLTADYPGGIGSGVHISWLDPQKVRLMTVVGSRKMIVYDDTQADAKVAVYDKSVSKVGPNELGSFETFGQFQLLHRAGDVLLPKIDFVEPLQVELQHFVECIRDGTNPLTDGRAGLAVVQALEASQRSLRSNGALVDVEPGPSSSSGDAASAAIMGRARLADAPAQLR